MKTHRIEIPGAEPKVAVCVSGKGRKGHRMVTIAIACAGVAVQAFTVPADVALEAVRVARGLFKDGARAIASAAKG